MMDNGVLGWYGLGGGRRIRSDADPIIECHVLIGWS